MIAIGNHPKIEPEDLDEWRESLFYEDSIRRTEDGERFAYGILGEKFRGDWVNALQRDR